MNSRILVIPGIGTVSSESGLIPLTTCSDGVHVAGQNEVVSIIATGDGKVEFIAFADHTLAYVRSALGYPAYYPVHPVAIQQPVKAVLMDLDGASVHSEGFWIWIIQRTIASLLEQPAFELEDADLPYVSGHSVSEHLSYCLAKYGPEKSLEEARRLYFVHARAELAAIAQGEGRVDAFQPAPGLKEFLLTLKGLHIRIALVTSGLYEKAYPAIVAVFHELGLGDPKTFYDAIITAGFPLQAGSPGTLGELTPKPHPWLYAEAATVGLGIPFAERHHVVGVEDSGAGVCSIRLAGFAAIGVDGGNINQSGVRDLCSDYCHSLDEILEVISAQRNFVG